MASKKKVAVPKHDLNTDPVSQVFWLHRDYLIANDYNPNHVAPAELELLIVSILEDGYTQPLVVFSQEVKGKRQIVDGFHRWHTSADKRLMAKYNGLVPCIKLDKPKVHDRMMSTVRHNRARGVHGVLPMAEIVRSMVDSGLKPKEIQARLGMEDEEIDRLVDRSGSPKRSSGAAYGKSFIPKGAKVKRRKK